MASKVLVAYGSKYGATAEIAEEIGRKLEKTGQTIDVLQAGAVSSVDAYDAVVLGSAVYAGSWRKDAVAFLQTHEAALAKRPVWLFSSGPTGEGDAEVLLKGWRFPQAQQPLADRIAPREIAVFHGNIDAGRLNLFEKLIVRMVKAASGDFRDWDAIRAWAADVGQALAEDVA